MISAVFEQSLSISQHQISLVSGQQFWLAIKMQLLSVYPRRFLSPSLTYTHTGHFGLQLNMLLFLFSCLLLNQVPLLRLLQHLRLSVKSLGKCECIWSFTICCYCRSFSLLLFQSPNIKTKLDNIHCKWKHHHPRTQSLLGSQVKSY